MFWMQMDSRLLPELLEEMIVQLELMVEKKGPMAAVHRSGPYI